MKKSVIVVAGGSGLRMGHDVPKQFLPIGGKPILMHTLESFYRVDAAMHIVLVLPQLQIGYWNGLCRQYHFEVPHLTALGGETRFHSVKNGLAQVQPRSLVAVHDGVRPFVSADTIRRCFEGAALRGNAIPVVQPVESIRQVLSDGSIAVDRNVFKLVQTPQVFRWEQISAAYELPYDPLFTDDASVVEKAGFVINLVDGNRENVKITTPFDLLLAGALLASPGDSGA
ncbi:MAG: 2-C-methyl-D-erythritol 4-phosphate cytidylyltransferase [Breznakibacter sp.]